MRDKTVILASLVLLGCAAGVEPRVLPTAADDSSAYQAMVSKVKQRAADADFTQLRMTYTRSELYAPHAVTETRMIDTMFDYIETADYDACIRLAAEVLSFNYTSLTAHYGAMYCHAKAGDRERGRYHRYVLRGLVDSIAHSGDGATPGTAFTAISTPELRAFVELGGLVITDQELLSTGGRMIDRLTVMNMDTDERFFIYFDVSIPVGMAAGALD